MPERITFLQRDWSKPLDKAQLMELIDDGWVPHAIHGFFKMDYFISNRKANQRLDITREEFELVSDYQDPEDFSIMG